MQPLQLLVGSLLALVFSTPILACSCVGGTPPMRFNRAQAVFVGQVQAGTESFTIRWPNREPRKVEAGSVSLTVEEVFKGSLREQVTLEVASNRDNSCGPYGLEPGVRYLMYAYATEAEPTKLYSGACSSSTPLDSDPAREDLQFLRNLPARGTGGTLSGRVMENLRWQGNNPFPNFKVLVRGPVGDPIEVVTDAAGQFEIKGLAPGKYRIEPQFPAGYTPEYARTFEVKVDDLGTAMIRIEAFLDGRVTGQVFDRQGRGYNRAFLMMEPEGVPPRQVLSTVYGHSIGEQGAFEFVGVPPGRYRMFLEFRHMDHQKSRRYYYPGTFERSKATVISLGRAQAVRDLSYPLPQDILVHFVEGQVVSMDGRPAGKAAVSLQCPRSTDPDRGVLETRVNNDVAADDNGRFRLEALSGTRYQIEARVDGAAGTSALHSPAIRLQPTADVRDQQLVISKPGLFDDCPPQEVTLEEPPRGVSKVEWLVARTRDHLRDRELIEPPGASARDTVLRLRALAPKHPDTVSLGRELVDRLLEVARRAMAAGAYERAAQLLRAAREMGSDSDPAALVRAETELKGLREESGR